MPSGNSITMTEPLRGARTSRPMTARAPLLSFRSTTSTNSIVASRQESDRQNSGYCTVLPGPRCHTPGATGGCHRWVPQVGATGGCHRWVQLARSCYRAVILLEKRNESPKLLRCRAVQQSDEISVSCHLQPGYAWSWTGRCGPTVPERQIG
jgi:hypothetical protein